MTDPGLCKRLNWLAILQKAATTGRFVLPIPETWTSEGGGLLLYTDQQGVVRRQNMSAADYFQLLTRTEKRGVQPKYVQLGPQGLAKLLYSKAHLRQALQAGHSIQRYVPPAGSEVHKLLFHWTRHQPVRGYRVTLPRNTENRLKGKETTLSVIAWLRRVEACDVQIEGKLSEGLLQFIERVREMVEVCGLQSEEVLQELVLSGMRTATGQVLLLNCRRGKVQSVREARSTALLRRSSLALEHPLPALHRDQTVELASRVLTRIAEHRDHMFSQAKERKRHSLSQIEQVKLPGYPAWFIPRCVERVYDEVQAEPRLLRYFPHKERISSHIQTSLKQVFAEGSTPSKIASIHRNMRIAEVDFLLYLEKFEIVLTAVGMTRADTQKIILYLSSFKSCIVKTHTDSSFFHHQSNSLILP